MALLETTIKNCASLIIDDLVASGSFLRTQVSACDYAILETSAATCAIVVQPLTSTARPLAFGTQEYAWGFRLECYVKDTGRVPDTLTRVYDIHDAVAAAIMTGACLHNDAGRDARVTSFSRPPDSFVEFNGHDYLPVYISVTVTDEG